MIPNKISNKATSETDIPILQTDCCKKVCEDLNDEITARKESITRTRFFKPGVHETSFANVQEHIDALEEFRERLKDERICECDLLQERKFGRKRAPTTIPAGIARLAKSGEPVLPYSLVNGCCLDVCKVLNSQIKFIDNILDASVMVRAGTDIEPMKIEAAKKEEMGRRFMEREEMEKRAISKAESEMLRNGKFISLAYQSYALKQYRTYMKKSGICECEL